MADNGSWKRAATNVGLIAVAALAYYFAQTAINKQYVALPALQYLDCLQRVGNIDWGRYGVTDHPSASEVCQERTGYRP